MKVQVTLTVAEAKALIAEAIAGMSEVQTALQTGRILLKGGTTVAAVAQRLANIDLRLSGRISPGEQRPAAEFLQWRIAFFWRVDK